MSASGNPKKKSGKGRGGPTTVSSKESWKAGRRGTPVEVPSGNTCLVQNPGMQVFMEQGFIPNSLLAIVQESMETGNAPNLTTEDLDMEKMKDMLTFMDAVVCFCVLEPKVLPVPKYDDGTLQPLHERDEDQLYVDEVDMEDKSFIFQLAMGGTRDLERFRQEQAAAMASLSAGEELEDDSESADEGGG